MARGTRSKRQNHCNKGPSATLSLANVALKPEDLEFSNLQERLKDLPNEIRDHIFIELLKLCLQPGKIFLNRHGKPDLAVHGMRSRRRDRYRRPDLSIFLALSKAYLPLAAKLLYQGNTFVLPSGLVSSDFFERWNRADILILPFVELAITDDDVCYYRYLPCCHRPNPDPVNFDFRRNAWQRSLSPPIPRPSRTSNMACGVVDLTPLLYRRWLLDTFWYKQFCVQDLRRGQPISDQLDQREKTLKAEPLEDVPLPAHQEYAPRKSLLWPALACPEGSRGQVISFTEKSKKNLAEHIISGAYATFLTQADHECLDSLNDAP